MDKPTVSVVNRLDELAKSGLNKPLQNFADNVTVLLDHNHTPKMKSIDQLEFELSNLKHFQAYYHSFEHQLTKEIIPKLLNNNDCHCLALKETTDLLNAICFRWLQLMFTSINYLEDDLYSKQQELTKRRDKRQRYKLNKTVRNIENGQS